MGKARLPVKVKLIVGLLSQDVACNDNAIKRLKNIFGSTDFESNVLDFKFTDYYREEMGQNLKRKFLSFGRLARLEDIYNAKIKTNGLETRLSKSGKRTVNIDPGYLELSKLVLLTTKDYSHRIYLRKGIYAESTLYFKDNAYNAWPWTYPDYKTQEYMDIFRHIRGLYKNQLDEGLR